MSVLRGPLRIVFIRSGNYDYADLDLSGAVHLVAGNNVGKTTLIAALQFLYIDDARQMHFSHDWKETRRHYFPHVGSMVLFECMTPTGFQVIAFRGLGPVQGFEFERLIYAGAYDRTDFLDGRQVRPWDEVSRRLVGRELRVPLEPRHLRASLLASGDTKGPPLGLVPLARTGNYDSFRFLFRNLLRLSRIEQDQLKRLFIDISRPRLRQVEVDLRRDYAELFSRVEREADSVVALQRVAPSIRHLVERFERRSELRAELVTTWRRLERELGRLRAETERDAAVEAQEHARLHDEQQALATKEAELRERTAEINITRGRVENALQRLRDLEERVREFLPAWEEQLRQQLTATRDDFVARLTNATKARHTDVQRDLDRVDAAIAADERTLERFADAVATWLRAHHGLRDSDLDDVFRILNPHLLGGVIGTGEGDVHVVDADRLVAVLRQVAASFDAVGFASAGVVVPRAALHADSPLARFTDVEALRDRVEQARTRRADLAQTLDDIRQRDEIERQRAAADSELEAARARLHDWDAWQLSQDQAREHEARLEQLERQITDAEREAHQLRERQTEVALDLRELERAARERKAEYESALADVQRLTAPPQGWESAEEAGDTDGPSLAELASGYRRRWADHGDVARRLEHLFSDVAHQTAERYVGADEVATIALLRDELEALADRERSVEELWAGLVDGMRSAFKGLLEGVDELKRQVSTLNQKLNRRQISNLEQVELELQPVQDMLRRLRAVLEAENAPLFSGPEGRSRAARDIALWMQDRPRIDLIDLFDLRFRVVDRAGRTKTFTSLSQIESQGTSTTIKVLVHLELLKSMLTNEPVSIPFFLDEVATLDDANLRGLIEHAKGMGFVPVVASPKPSDAAETLYFLRQGPGGLILDETSRLVIERTTNGA